MTTSDHSKIKQNLSPDTAYFEGEDADLIHATSESLKLLTFEDLNPQTCSNSLERHMWWLFEVVQETNGNGSATTATSHYCWFCNF
nr:hypothetical protein Iba_chr14aCG5860 [Ipomoea batatas]